MRRSLSWQVLATVKPCPDAGTLPKQQGRQHDQGTANLYCIMMLMTDSVSFSMHTIQGCAPPGNGRTLLLRGAATLRHAPVEMESKTPETTRFCSEFSLKLASMPMPMATPMGVVNAKTAAMNANAHPRKSACGQAEGHQQSGPPQVPPG